ncbi:unnamed protein product [Moneuplotes crassus]|uniref:Uncharacterized protein n=1 Tax=Euplotes crassus TaxID=5936 RepID=A0AAD1XXZ7_EUPCR|nr:unnamed protein product [Moneuplotes crassus]
MEENNPLILDVDKEVMDDCFYKESEKIMPNERINQTLNDKVCDSNLSGMNCQREENDNLNKTDIGYSVDQTGDAVFSKKKPPLLQSAPHSILVHHGGKTERRDRLGTLIRHDEECFESQFTGTPPPHRKRKSYKVTFKDKQTGDSLTKIKEVESFKKYNSVEPEAKLCCIIF